MPAEPVGVGKVLLYNNEHDYFQSSLTLLSQVCFIKHEGDAQAIVLTHTR